MDRYTIHCTESQTRKALELGASIPNFHNALVSKDVPHFYVGKVCSQSWDVFVQPTAEQMIGWLEGQGITSIEITFSKETKWKFEMFSEIYDYDAPYYTRSEATLAAIDAALEYLTKNKK